MSKDLEWFKKKVRQNSITTKLNGKFPITSVVEEAKVIYLIDQIEQLEITHEQALNKIAEKYPFIGADIDDILEVYTVQRGFEQPKLPVIPDYVADYIEEMQIYLTLGEVAESLYNEEASENWSKLSKSDKWIRLNFTTFAIAWTTDNYTVEEKKTYEVKDNHGKNLLFKVIGGLREDKVTSRLKVGESGSYLLTEQEIKEYDERFWAFAIPIEELKLEGEEGL